jgi:gas vesicle protein
MKRLRSVENIVGALMAGALVGAALGLLFAPNKGSKTRRKIANGASDTVKDLKKKMKKETKALRSKANDLIEYAEDKVDNVANAVIKKAESLKQHN